MKIERTLFNTVVNNLQVIKTVDTTDLPFKGSSEYCISVAVASEIISDSQYLSPKGYGTARFFGETYDEANDHYLHWLSDVLEDTPSASNNYAMAVVAVIEALEEQ